MTKLEKKFIAQVLEICAEEVWNNDSDFFSEVDARMMEKLAKELRK